MIMKPYYKYSIGEVFEVRHEPDKYWLAIVIYSFDQLHLFKWLGSYGEFWHDSTISEPDEKREEGPAPEEKEETWSRASATKQLFNPGHHMRYRLESKFTLEKPTTFLMTPTSYNPADDPYGNITTVEDLLALESNSTSNNHDNNEVNTTPPPTTTNSNPIITEKLDNIISAVIEELEEVKNSNPVVCDELPQNLSSCSQNILQVPILEENADPVSTTTITQLTPNEATSSEIEKQSTDSDTIMTNNESNEFSTIANKQEPMELVDEYGIKSQICGRLDCLGIDFEKRKRELSRQHSSAVQKGVKISIDDWVKMNSKGATMKLYKRIVSENSQNYQDIRDLCKIIQFQAQFEIYQSPLNGEVFKVSSIRDRSNEFFDLSILNDDNRMQLEYDRIINEKSMFIKIYFNHKCFTGPSLSKSKICSLPQYVGPGPLNLVIEEVVTKVISVAYVPPRILNDLSSQTFMDLLTTRGLSNTTLMEFKAKYQKRIHRDAIPICVSPSDLALYCECLCEHLKCCYNLFGPSLYDGDDCPGHCRALTKSNKFMKRATYYREKARNGEFLSGSNESGANKKQTLGNNGNNTFKSRQGATKPSDTGRKSVKNFRPPAERSE